jgi:hypothetical protein
MFALVENNQFVKIVNSNKGIELNGIQYPKSIFTLWTNTEREAIGIYEVTVDSSNKRDEEYYINTNITYTFANGSVTGSYGTATAKPLDDVLFVEGDEIPDDKAVGDVKQYGLKGICKTKVNEQANGLLSKYDWYVITEQM